MENVNPQISDKKVEEYFKKIAQEAGLDLSFAILSTDGKYIACFTKDSELQEIHIDLQIAPAIVIEMESYEFIDEQIPSHAALIKKAFEEKTTEIIDTRDNLQ